MVCAKLHLICGNCGCNDMWEYKIDLQGKDINGKLYPQIYLICNNCDTVHTLEEVNAIDRGIE